MPKINTDEYFNMTTKKTETFSLTVASKAKNLEVIRKFIVEIAEKGGFSKEAIGQIELAVDEASTNVIKHAHRFNADKNVDILVKLDAQKMVIKICDHGSGFDVKRVAPPDLKKYIQEAKKGGLGIHLMRNLMDKVSFSSQSKRGNCVTLVKYIS